MILPALATNAYDQWTLLVLLATVLAVFAHALRQPVILAYILAGLALGPYGLSFFDTESVALDGPAHLGIVLLLFLAGMELQLRKIMEIWRLVTTTTLLGSVVFFTASFALAKAFCFPTSEALVIGAALMFSSTILVVKLLPTVALHQKHRGAVCIAVLVLQDLLAIGVLIWLKGGDSGGAGTWILPLKLILLAGLTFLVQRYGLRFLLKSLQRSHELLYLVALGWCVGLSLVAHWLGMSHEVGGFLAGVALAQNPLSAFIFEGLRFIRDFFLVIFFVLLGCRLDLGALSELWLPTLVVGGTLLLLKPATYKVLFSRLGENQASMELGLRLGQTSEFSLIIATAAVAANRLSSNGSLLIQYVTILTLLISSYLVVFRYPSPMGRGKLKQD